MLTGIALSTKTKSEVYKLLKNKYGPHSRIAYKRFCLQHIDTFGLATFDDLSDNVPYIGDIIIDLPFYDPSRLIPLIFTHVNSFPIRWIIL